MHSLDWYLFSYWEGRKQVSKEKKSKAVKKEIRENLAFVRGNLEVSYTRVNGKAAEQVNIFDRDEGRVIYGSLGSLSYLKLEHPRQVRDLIQMLTDVLDGAYE